jgi:hypothetical protein
MCMRSQVKIQKRALVIFVFLGTWSFSGRHTKLASKKAFNFFYATHWYAYCLTVPAACSPLKLRIIRKQARVYFVDGETVLLRKKKEQKRGRHGNVGETMEAATFCSHQWLSRSPRTSSAGTWQHDA